MPSCHSPRLWLLLATVCAAQFLVVLDITIVNVALPAIGETFRLPPDEVQWVVSAYAVAFAGCLLLAGRLADLRGRTRVFVAGLAVFGASSLACGLAPGGEALVAARTLQGVGAALLSPAALAILLAAFPDGPARTRALGAWGAIGAGAASLGVLAGGIVVEVADWRWVFLLNVPVALAALVLARVALPRDAATRAGRVDAATAALLTAGLALLVAAVSDAGGHADRALLALALAAGLLGLCVRRERRAGEPLIPLAAIGSRAQAAANAAGLLLGAIMLGSFLLLTLYMQGVLGLSPLQTGVGLLAARGTGLAWTPVTTRLAQRYGSRTVLLLGMSAMTAGTLLLARAPADGSYVADVLPGLLVLGFAIPSLFLAVSLTALDATRPEHGGTASAVLSTSQWVGGALGVALASAVAGATELGSGETGTALAHGVATGFVCLAVLAALGVILALASPGSRTARATRLGLLTRRREPRLA